MEQSTDKNKRIRYHLLDTVRGVLIVGVIISHLLYDLTQQGLGGLGLMAFTSSPPVELVQTVGRALFVLIAGICCKLSSSNLKRGMLCLAAALLVSVVTAFIPGAFIYMGILHLLGICMLSYGVVEMLTRERFMRVKASTLACCVLSTVFIAFFVLTFRIHDKSCGIGAFGTYLRLENAPYGSLIGVLLGFGGYVPASADYFPLMPWTFMFIAGVFIGNIFKNGAAPDFFVKNLCPPLSFVGRHTLIIYLAHQPIVYGIVLLICMIL